MELHGSYIKRSTFFMSKNGKTKLNTVVYIPEGREPRAILQIAHGMAEYILRYEPFASYLAGEGFIVAGHDHLGHGKSVNTWSDYGYFSTKPLHTLIRDMHQLRVNMAKRYPGLPYFMMGHSMGSYLLRSYLALYGEGLSGAVIMGTGYAAPVAADFGIEMTKLLAAFKGWHYRSLMVQAMTYNKSYRGYDVTSKDPKKSWLTKDYPIAEKYQDDPLCGFLFSLNGHKGLFEAVHFSCMQKNVNRIPGNLPILLVSGQEDPVGDRGKGVEKVFSMMEKAGIGDLTLKLYPGDRHEILNETDRERVMEDILDWLSAYV